MVGQSPGNAEGYLLGEIREFHESLSIPPNFFKKMDMWGRLHEKEYNDPV